MRIAVTADLHLTNEEDNPERFEVLKDILHQCEELDVDRLIISGDLFDQSPHNLAAFEVAYQDSHPTNLPVSVIPGNHDLELQQSNFAVDDLTVITEPTLETVDNDFQLLPVPYKPGTTLGQHLAGFGSEIQPGRWALISHGDWMGGVRPPDPSEPGVYMPLTRADLVTYQPATVLLGHIHVPFDQGKVHYPGSPCPLDPSETGLRRFLVFDTDSHEIIPHRVNSPYVYFDETVVMLPVEDEEVYLESELNRRIEKWDLPAGWGKRARVRLKVMGYSADRAQVNKLLKNALSSFELLDGSPDVSGLNTADDPDRVAIVRQVSDWVNELEWSEEPLEPAKSDIIREALGVIYGA